MIPFLTGKNDQILKRLQAESNTEIYIQQNTANAGDQATVLISAKKATDVVQAKLAIDIILSSTQDSGPYTHFLSLPLNAPEVQEKFSSFVRNALETCEKECTGLEESIFVRPSSLHMTLCMLRLHGPELLAAAKGALCRALFKWQSERQRAGVQAKEEKKDKELEEDVEEEGKKKEKKKRNKKKIADTTNALTFALKGLEIMNDDPSEVHVCYANIEEKEGLKRLDTLCSLLLQELVHEGLLSEQELVKQGLRLSDGSISVKYHCTVLNTKHRRGRASKSGRQPVDARALLTKFGKVDLGEQEVRELHLSSLNGADTGTGYYKAEQVWTLASTFQEPSDHPPSHVPPPSSTNITPRLDIWPAQYRQSQEEKKKNSTHMAPPGLSSGKRSKVQILGPGLVLISDFLSLEVQQYLVNMCREYGVQEAGFMTPNFQASADHVLKAQQTMFAASPQGPRLNLQMFCFGYHWDNRTGKYEQTRSTSLDSDDNGQRVEVPRLPSSLLQYATQACEKANATLAAKRMDLYPKDEPDICLVNFYEPHSGRLGVHQDRDETPSSLRRGVPVISFSIGDSADFVYGATREEAEKEAEKDGASTRRTSQQSASQSSVTSRKASSKDASYTAGVVTLKSGDALLFGGEARMVYHGVTKIYPNTTPYGLVMRPGRLNLTFRVH
eukprot:g45311.t1